MKPEPHNENDRLARLYTSLCDNDLLKLREDFEALTDDAQQALRAELRTRRLSLAEEPSAQSKEAPAAGYVFETRTERGIDGLVYLIGFHDGIELGLACDYLDTAEIDLAVNGPEPPNQSPPLFEIRVAPNDLARAQQVLQDTMGLFPPPETDVPQVEGRGYIDDGVPLALADFEDRGDAEQTAQLLTDAGINNRLFEPAEDPEDEPWYRIEVSAENYNRALQVAATALKIED